MRPDAFSVSVQSKGFTFATFVRNWAAHDSLVTLCDGGASQLESVRAIAKTFAPHEAKGINRDTVRAAKAAVPVSTTSGLGLNAWDLAQAEILSLANGLGVFTPALGLRPIPFDKPFDVLSTPDGGAWIDENAPKVPATSTGTGFAGLGQRKLVHVLVASDDLFRVGGPALEAALTTDLAASLQLGVDTAAFTQATPADPARPNAITVGAPVITASGDIAADIGSAVAAYTGDLMRIVAVANPATIIRLALTAGTSGGFPGPRLKGGTLGGMPLYASSGCPSDEIILFDPASVFYAEDPLGVRTSNQADMEMLAPPNNPPTATTIRLSLWQGNLRGVITERIVNWSVPPPGSCVVIKEATP